MGVDRLGAWLVSWLGPVVAITEMVMMVGVLTYAIWSWRRVKKMRRRSDITILFIDLSACDERWFITRDGKTWNGGGEHYAEGKMWSYLRN
jgi:hypothetical protein